MGAEPHPSLTAFWASLRLFCLVWGFCLKKNERKRVCSSSFSPRLRAHFFLSSPGGALGGGWGCHDADGLYFDYGALVVMGDRRRGVATLSMCLYKSGTQTPKSLVIPWPKLIRTLTDDWRCCSQLFLWVTSAGMLKKKEKHATTLLFLLTSLSFWIYSYFVTFEMFSPTFWSLSTWHALFQVDAEHWRLAILTFGILFMFFMLLGTLEFIQVCTWLRGCAWCVCALEYSWTVFAQ